MLPFQDEIAKLSLPDMAAPCPTGGEFQFRLIHLSRFHSPEVQYEKKQLHLFKVETLKYTTKG